MTDTSKRGQYETPLIKLSGTLAERHALRAYDTIQLASALVLQRELQAAQVAFVAADVHLLKAAEQERLAITRITA